jgi:hypothetical protein
MKSDWKNFTKEELSCSCCNEQNPNLEFRELMDIVQEMREELGFPFEVSSAYRCENHHIEAAKDKPGMHSIAAIDIRVHSERAYDLMEAAIAKGFTGIGFSQKGDHKYRFIHLDMREERDVWSY